MNSKILKFEILGIAFISLAGSLLHFAFNLLNRFWLAGVFSAVNESTWEHLKLAVIPALAWAFLESRIFKGKANNFLCAKASGIYLTPILIAVFFYSYTIILGYNLLVFDISIFVLAVAIGQMASYKIMTLPEFSQRFNAISFLSLIIFLSAFAVFTFYPPRIFLFQDPISGQYGIIKPIIGEEPVACTMEAKECPDGSYVGRVPPECDFAPCPEARTIKLYYYNYELDKDESGNIACSRNGLVPVERKIPITQTPIQDAIKLLLLGELTEEERAQGIDTEYPLKGFFLEGASLKDGVLTLGFDDSENRAVGGSCRVGILWFQIEATAKQFSGVQQVRFLPEEIFQP